MPPLPRGHSRGGGPHRPSLAGLRLLAGAVRALAGQGGTGVSAAPGGVLAAVDAAVRAAPGAGLLPDIAAHVRGLGVDAGVADVNDALTCLCLVGVVSKGTGGRWLPGPWSLQELPVPITELEALWKRERRKRVKHAYRYR